MLLSLSSLLFKHPSTKPEWRCIGAWSTQPQSWRLFRLNNSAKLVGRTLGASMSRIDTILNGVWGRKILLPPLRYAVKNRLSFNDLLDYLRENSTAPFPRLAASRPEGVFTLQLFPDVSDATTNNQMSQMSPTTNPSTTTGASTPVLGSTSTASTTATSSQTQQNSSSNVTSSASSGTMSSTRTNDTESAANIQNTATGSTTNTATTTTAKRKRRRPLSKKASAQASSVSRPQNENAILNSDDTNDQDGKDGDQSTESFDMESDLRLKKQLLSVLRELMTDFHKLNTDLVS
eukprot:TRINITY_DN12886_c0_g1::TRINITY_DN12886_c0_g1_i1::g.8076::m.8076 TRINITY_DN12886_c0_g1::TRINITY_DN12886_c0_g1_i1::g.8076  ORF type:complete len:291 (-),score=24.57,Med3/PF11593.3/0.00073,TFIIA/PF03153.8/0.051,Nucleo_P87/PF07267.6/0.45,Macoilin/PF09726.4/5,DUF566/PF04484.7/6.3,Pneumo_att_G/PF05539.6/7.2,Peptidase_S64/PF08192.6/11,DDHD/PF02862.12/17 TRINITY_DN12886_c0_g1_i1:360-1232(-)